MPRVVKQRCNKGIVEFRINNVNITMWVVRLRLLHVRGSTYEIHRKGVVLEGDNKYKNTFTVEETRQMPCVKHIEIISATAE